MALAAGTRLGPYEVHSLIGAGGMGEVYRARDTQLKRDVALKILPAELALEPERLARFDREAQALAALNHPHIAQVHGFVHEGDVRAIVMELVVGATLTERIARGPVPVDEALPTAVQLAEALEYAHECGVVHRDLKPANIKVTPDGAVKVLDFGLAKVLADEAAGASSDLLGNSPTMTSPAMSRVGVILGTAAYMAPEQARGTAVDKRADNWAFGVVLFEMLTGKPCFSGDTVTDVMAAVVRAEPDWSKLPASASPRLRSLLRRCLAKDRRQRLQAIGDARIELAEMAAAPEVGTTTAANDRRHVVSRTLPVIAGAALVLVGAALASLWWWTRPTTVPAATPVRAEIILPAGLALDWGVRSSVALSDDGRLLAYGDATADGLPRGISIRPVNRFEPTHVAGTEGGTAPFFSPDGQWLGFFVAYEGKLKKVAMSGGAPLPIAELADVRGASWGQDDTIVFAQRDGGLLQIRADGGNPQQLTTPSSERKERTHRLPHFLPNGKGVIFTIGTNDITSFADAKVAVYVFSTKQSKVLFEGGSDARYLSPGYLVYSRGRSLMAVRFDLERLEVVGTPVSLVDSLLASSVYGTGNFALSGSGVLAYVPGSENIDHSQLVVIDRNGGATLVGDQRLIVGVRVSPTGDRAAIRVGGANDTAWVQDLRPGGTSSRLTFRGNVTGAIWTPDGRRIIYNIGSEIASLAADGSGDDHAVYRDEFPNVPESIFPNGKTVLFRTTRPGTGSDIWTLSLEDGKAHALLSAPFNERYARLSPDGRWLAYTSDESGRDEVYVRPYPALGSLKRVSRAGGSFPVWSHDSRQIYFMSGADLYAANVSEDGGGFDTDVPHKVSTPRIGSRFDMFDLMPGNRILAVQITKGPPPTAVRLVTGWLDELKQRLPIR